MKQFLNLIASSRLTVILLLLFAISIGTATFVEEKYDTATARALIYNAKWFELIFLLMMVNFIAQIARYKLFRREKLTILTFHLAFIILILGAGITRYIGYEGMMRIREGSQSNIMYTSESYFQVRASDRTQEYNFDKPLYTGRFSNNSFNIRFETSDKQPVEIRYKMSVANAVVQLTDNVPGGEDYLEIIFAGTQGRQTVMIKRGETVQVGSSTFSFDAVTSQGQADFSIRENAGAFSLLTGREVSELSMSTLEPINTEKDSLVLMERGIYRSGEFLFTLAKVHRSAREQLVSSPEEEAGHDALIVEVSYKGTVQEVPVYRDQDFEAGFQQVKIDDLALSMGYGSKAIELPFSIQLNDFILERYAGSMSPSSFASEVTLIDPGENLKEDHRIFMNNVLDHDGYRFFQSSYDRDEKGTILSVNHDFIGTWVSYFGYFLLGLGFILTLFNRKSHFYSIFLSMGQISKSRKNGLGILLGLFLAGSSLSAQGVSKPVSNEHAEKFGKLLVQSFDGRFQPVNTLAFDVMHKISRKDKIDAKGKGELTVLQASLDMLIDPRFWKNERIIYVREKSVRDVLGISGKYASFADFFNAEGSYKLAGYAETAFRKRQSEQNVFDKEIIRVDERVNVFMMALNGDFLKLFPKQASSNNTWVNWTDTSAFRPLQGAINVINEDLHLPVLSYNQMFRAYLGSLVQAGNTGDYREADKILAYISSIQQQSSAASIIPTEKHIKWEVYYNEANIFILLKRIFSFLSLFLLVFAFVDELSTKRIKLVSWALNFFIGLTLLAFVYHTFGLGLRWYLSGHAPWSNGYEALLLMAWGSLLAGFLFMRYSRIVIAASTLLAFFMLMTASHSSYDPQLTNLQPVLKSYWLIIHVAVITVSYAFLGSGFILGLINLILYLFKNIRNYRNFDQIIQLLTHLNEILLVIGLVLATAGTFLGGIWANESWGRYWGWDAKETWALVIVIVYGMIMHFRMVTGLKGTLIFNIASVIAFSTVVMTFVGVNYYLSKGMHSYAAGDTVVFPLWAWIMIIGFLSLIVLAGMREKQLQKKLGLKK
ncbi:MAG: cytochrome c biogenesis protein CcsA [Bacteroidales bacterium]